MTTYIRNQWTYTTYNGFITKVPDEGVNQRFDESNTVLWDEYQAWLAVPNTPEDEFSFQRMQTLAYEYADSQYDTAISQPINDGTDDIDMSLPAKTKIHNAKATGRTSIKVKRKNGKAKTYTDTELDDLLDAIEDRDDTALDTLDSTYDAIEAATTFEELEPYLPPLS